MAYQVLKEDEKHYLVKHPDGSHFKVAKKGLKPSTLKKISGMVVQHKAYGGEVYPQNQLMQDMETPAPEAEQAPEAGQNEGPQTVPSPGPSPNLMAQGEEQPAQAPTYNDLAPMPQGMPVQKQAPAPDYMKDMNSAMGQYAAGIKGEANAAAEQAEGTSKAYDNYLKESQEIQRQYQEKYQKLDQEHDALTKAYADGTIDPKRYWNTLSTTNKVTASLAVVLSGIGSGMSGQPNLALQVIDKAIDRDIDAQKANLGKTANLLSLNMQKYGNLHQAEMATRLNANAALQATVAQMAAKAAAPAAQARAQQLLAQLKMSSMQMKQQMAQSQAVASLANGQSASINPELLPKDVRERLVTVPGANGANRQALAFSKEGAEDIRKSVASTQEIQKKVSEAQNFIKEKGWSPSVMGWSTADKARAESIRNSVISSMGKLHDLNRLNEQEYKMYSEMVPNPGQLNQAAAAEKFKYLGELIQQKLNSTYANELEGYNPGGIRESAPMMNKR